MVVVWICSFLEPIWKTRYVCFIFEERDEHGKKECLDINGFGAFRPTNVLKSSGISVHHLNN